MLNVYVAIAIVHVYYSQGCGQGETLLHLEFRPLLGIPGGRRPPLNLFSGGGKVLFA